MVDRASVVVRVATALGRGALLIGLVALASFALLRALPGDPADKLAAPDTPRSLQTVADAWRSELPLLPAFARYARSAARGDLGLSTTRRRPVVTLLAEALGPSLLLAVSGLAVALAVGIAMALAAWRTRPRRRDQWDLVLSSLAVVPRFWLGLLLAVVFHTWLSWLPSSHIAPAGDTASGIHVAHLVLPAITLAVPLSALFARVLLGALDTVDGARRLQLAQASGLFPLTVFLRHLVWPQASVLAAMVAADLPMLVSGAVMVETVFAWPGLGRLSAEAISSADLPLAMAGVMIASLTAACGSWFADRWSA